MLRPDYSNILCNQHLFSIRVHLYEGTLNLAVDEIYRTATGVYTTRSHGSLPRLVERTRVISWGYSICDKYRNRIPIAKNDTDGMINVIKNLTHSECPIICMWLVYMKTLEPEAEIQCMDQ